MKEEKGGGVTKTKGKRNKKSEKGNEVPVLFRGWVNNLEGTGGERGTFAHSSTEHTAQPSLHSDTWNKLVSLNRGGRTSRGKREKFYVSLSPSDSDAPNYVVEGGPGTIVPPSNLIYIGKKMEEKKRGVATDKS